MMIASLYAFPGNGPIASCRSVHKVTLEDFQNALTQGIAAASFGQPAVL